MLDFFLNLFLVVIILLIFFVFYNKFSVNRTETFNCKSKKKVRFNENENEIYENVSVKEDFQEDFENTAKKSMNAQLAVPNNFNKIRKDLLTTYNNINPGNFYENDFNTPNFVSNVTDVREYYDYNTYNDKTENEVPKTPYKEQTRFPENSSQIIDKASLRPAYLHPEATGENLPMDQWYYKDELPMNGGSFGNITGFDDLGYANAVFQNDFIPTSPETKPNDDLRNGMGTPQKQMYEYNMSQIS